MERIVERLSMEQDKKKHNELIGVRCCMNQFTKVFDFMRCSLCTKVCLPQSKSCVRGGHMVCNECFERVKLCPFVKKVNNDGTKVFCLSNLETLRLKLYEQLYAAMDVVMSCAFLDFGCQEMLRQDDLNKHQALCKFRPDFACITTGCNITKLSGPMLIDHLAKSHNTLVIYSNHDNVTICFEDALDISHHFAIWTPVVFYCYDLTFLLTVKVDPINESMVQLRFYMLEDEGSAEQFQIHAHVNHLNNSEKPLGLWSEIPGKLSQMNMRKLEGRETECPGSDGFSMDLHQFFDNFVRDGEVIGTKVMQIDVSIDMVHKQEE